MLAMRAEKAAFRLYFMHFFAVLAIWMSTYFPGFDVLCTVLYIFFISLEVRSFSCLERIEKFKLGLWWLTPAVVLELIAKSSIVFYDLSNLAFFILQLWYTPFLPLVSWLVYHKFLAGWLSFSWVFVMPCITALHYIVLNVRRKPYPAGLAAKYD